MSASVAQYDISVIFVIIFQSRLLAEKLINKKKNDFRLLRHYRNI